MPVDNPRTVDVVERDAGGAVRAIHVKPEASDLREAWCLAAWGGVFSDWLHEQIGHILADPMRREQVDTAERHLGHLFQAAIEDGLSVRAVGFPDGQFLDVGTPSALHRALTTLQWEDDSTALSTSSA
jgi:glucose-1-phosphate thymidylyltransferase